MNNKTRFHGSEKKEENFFFTWIRFLTLVRTDYVKKSFSYETGFETMWDKKYRKIN